MSEADRLRAELLDTAAWLDERADVLLRLLACPAGWRPAAKVSEKREAIRTEAARLRGRAGLIRCVVDQVKAGV